MESLDMNVPDWQYHTRAVMHHCLENGMCLHMTPLGADTWKLMPGFSWTLPHTLLPFVDFSLYLFAVINYKHEYSCIFAYCAS